MAEYGRPSEQGQAYPVVRVEYEMDRQNALFQFDGARISQVLQGIGYPANTAIPIMVMDKAGPRNSLAIHDTADNVIRVYQPTILTYVESPISASALFLRKYKGHGRVRENADDLLNQLEAIFSANPIFNNSAEHMTRLIRLGVRQKSASSLLKDLQTNTESVLRQKVLEIIAEEFEHAYKFNNLTNKERAVLIGRIIKHVAPKMTMRALGGLALAAGWNLADNTLIQNFQTPEAVQQLMYVGLPILAVAQGRKAYRHSYIDEEEEERAKANAQLHKEKYEGTVTLNQAVLRREVFNKIKKDKS